MPGWGVGRSPLSRELKNPTWMCHTLPRSPGRLPFMATPYPACHAIRTGRTHLQLPKHLQFKERSHLSASFVHCCRASLSLSLSLFLSHSLSLSLSLFFLFSLSLSLPFSSSQRSCFEALSKACFAKRGFKSYRSTPQARGTRVPRNGRSL